MPGIRHITGAAGSAPEGEPQYAARHLDTKPAYLTNMRAAIRSRNLITENSYSAGRRGTTSRAWLSRPRGVTRRMITSMQRFAAPGFPAPARP